MKILEEPRESLSVVMSTPCGHITHNWQTQTTRYENAKKTPVFGTGTLIKNPSGKQASPSSF